MHHAGLQPEKLAYPCHRLWGSMAVLDPGNYIHNHKKFCKMFPIVRQLGSCHFAGDPLNVSHNTNGKHRVLDGSIVKLLFFPKWQEFFLYDLIEDIW